jgi:hypothetical protein
VTSLRPGRDELALRDAVWEGLERRGIALAVIAFSGRAGKGGKVESITHTVVGREQPVNLERWRWPVAVVCALEAPVWDRFGAFAG